jgi:predicted DNA-binding transcriptional regulator AlpA
MELIVRAALSKARSAQETLTIFAREFDRKTKVCQKLQLQLAEMKKQMAAGVLSKPDCSLDDTCHLCRSGKQSPRPRTKRATSGKTNLSAIPAGMEGKNLLRMPQVQALTGAGRSTIYKWMDDGLLMRPIKINKSSCWTQEYIENWLASRKAGGNDPAGDAVHR